MTAIAAHRAFLHDVQGRQAERRALVDPSYQFLAAPPVSEAGPSRRRQPIAATTSKLNVANYIVAEETVRNDYCEWYGVSGEWGSNYVLGAGQDELCEEYPALRRLMDLKNELVESTSHTPLYLPLKDPDGLSSRPAPSAIQSAVTINRFDSILITPPQPIDWTYISSLPIRNISADPGFVYLWVGAASSDGLEKGRECFAKWGFRRAEDIVWVKTNKGEAGAEGRDEGGLFTGQKEHCLMGIRGTVRRSTDSRFVHCNVDTDVMVWANEAGSSGPHYPPYLQNLIENFCLGTRRLHLFGSPDVMRRGWVTAGTDDLGEADESPELFDADTYPSQIFKSEDGRHTLPYHPDIDNLRPKSPQRRTRNLPNAPSPSFGNQPRGGSANRQFGSHMNSGQHLSPQMPLIQQGYSPGISPSLGMGTWGMGTGQPGWDGGMGMDPHSSFGHQAGQYPHMGQQAHFDPMVLAQAQAQAHAMIQAQMQMAMMQQMQSQMGMGQQMGQGQEGIYGQFGQMAMGGNYGMGGPGQQQPGFVHGMAMGYGYDAGHGQQHGGGVPDWAAQDGRYGQGENNE